MASAIVSVSTMWVNTEIPYRLPFWREFCWVLLARVDSRVDTEFPYRVRIVNRGVDCRNPFCRHHFRFLETKAAQKLEMKKKWKTILQLARDKDGPKLGRRMDFRGLFPLSFLSFRAVLGHLLPLCCHLFSSFSGCFGFVVSPLLPVGKKYSRFCLV